MYVCNFSTVTHGLSLKSICYCSACQVARRTCTCTPSVQNVFLYTLARYINRYINKPGQCRLEHWLKLCRQFARDVLSVCTVDRFIYNTAGRHHLVTNREQRVVENDGMFYQANKCTITSESNVESGTPWLNETLATLHHRCISTSINLTNTPGNLHVHHWIAFAY
jgi:hypothetical protein